MKFAQDLNNYDGLWLQEVFFYLDTKHVIHKTNAMDQTNAPKGFVWRNKIKGIINGTKEN